MASQRDSICGVPSILVGHAQNDDAGTGCTVILPENGAVAGVDIRGSAPGTRDIEAIKLVRLVPKIDAVLFSGGSAFGLGAADGVQCYLEEQGVGFDVGVTTVPIVPSAVIFDLYGRDHRIRPEKQMGYDAAANAVSGPVAEGRVGAGRGATVGKLSGFEKCMLGGVGTACEEVAGISVGALAVVNAVGNIISPETGEVVAGARDAEGGHFLDYMKQRGDSLFAAPTNTTLAVVATDAAFTKEEITKVAQMAQDGLARAINPAHTPFDGDLVIALSVGERQADILTVGAVAAEVVAKSIVRAVKVANSIE